MNLADAIRKASYEPNTPAPTAGNDPTEAAPAATTDTSASPQMDAKQPEPASQHVASGNVVRLELFLTAEQMSGLFRAIVAGQHTVLTLREAAAYLRINPQTLVKLAEEGDVPGLLIDGKWRFPKPNLDDWLTLQTTSQEDSEDVA